MTVPKKNHRPTYDEFGPPSQQQITEWEKLDGEGIASAVGEYTPDEFWYLLDVVQGQQREIARLEQFIEGFVGTDLRNPNYLCPAGRAQLGLPAFKEKR